MDETELAELTRDGDFVTARMTRQIEHPAQVVWRALTEPAMLAQWLAPGRIELRLGGAAKLDFADSGTVIDSQVSAVEPGRVLEYSWSGPGEPLRPVRWELAVDGEATALTLIQKTPASEDPGRACAGWEAHLEMLQAALEGVPIKFPFESFKAARDAYRPLVSALGEA
ncbi:MAG TPA: SRPBCC family protein [Caulobacteraceae bacterium]|nr:SRPBCC family protein [Caulobacteraceae bacterium]